MAHSAATRVTSNGTDQSIGDLVSVAARDVSQLVRYEIELAKAEFKSDLRKAAISAVLGAVALFSACLVLILLCFAFAFGLIALGVFHWLAFIFVAITVLLLIAIAGLIAFLLVRRMNKMKKTRQTLSDDTSLLQRVKSAVKVATKVG